jgi:hypothetical protein
VGLLSLQVEDTWPISSKHSGQSLRILGHQESFANIIPWSNDAKTVTYLHGMYVLTFAQCKERSCGE